MSTRARAVGPVSGISVALLTVVSCASLEGITDITPAADAGIDRSIDSGSDAEVDSTSEVGQDAADSTTGSEGSADSMAMEATPGDSSMPDGDSGEAGPSGPLSCASGDAGTVHCGPGGDSCCTSLSVPGGTFYRSYDNVTYADSSNPATISNFRLDRYEITVGRFRQFVAAVDGGWLPAQGSGKHTQVNSGNGLNATGGGQETGWDATNWNPDLTMSSATWTANLSCNTAYQTWTASAGSNEGFPINCVSWYEAYAFCIWDGGFLPSEAEWNYAASGGGGSNGQRVYPWSTPPTSTTIDCTYANYAGTGCGNDAYAVGMESPKGDGLWGHADLEGNLGEWTLDFQATYVNPCTDCANLSTAANRTLRGGSFTNGAAGLDNAGRDGFTPTGRDPYVGARCARIP